MDGKPPPLPANPGKERAHDYMHGLAGLTPQSVDPRYLDGYRLGKQASGIVPRGR